MEVFSTAIFRYTFKEQVSVYAFKMNHKLIRCTRSFKTQQKPTGSKETLAEPQAWIVNCHWPPTMIIPCLVILLLELPIKQQQPKKPI